MKCLILAQSKVTANALRVWRVLFLGKSMAAEASSVMDIVFNLREFSKEGGIPAYRYLVRKIEEICELDKESSDYDSIVVLVDWVRPCELSPSINSVTWERLVSMLILTFPELQWVFGAFTGEPPRPEESFPRFDSSLSVLFKAQQTPLFDSSGIRDWIRHVTEEALKDKSKDSEQDRPTNHARRRKIDKSKEPHKERPTYLARRLRLAVAIDDESSYAYLNAYTAYRFGYRGSAVHSFTLAKELLNQNAVDHANLQTDPTRSIPAILFEDLFLNFADGVQGLSRLSPEDGTTGRIQRWPMIEDPLVQHRIFVTSDQRLYGDKDLHNENRHYISRQTAKGKNIRVLLKPYAGIFQLWKRAGGAALRPKWFIWPPHKSTFSEHPHDHSSSGPLLWVAETLIHRAEEILRDGVCCAQHAVRGAVLATDALELLGGRTATASVQALRLKHNLEVLAECQFAGVEHHFEIDDRLAEIRNNAEHISRWFGQHHRIRAALNTEMQVLLELARVLHDYGHFDEEQILSNRTRTIHNGLWVRQKPWRWVLWPMLRYIDFLLDSFPNFVLSMVAWIIFTAIAAWLVQPNPPGGGPEHASSSPLYSAIEFSLDAFVGKILPPAQNTARDVLYAVAGIAGLLHIGALVSLIYSKVTRK